ncbi:MAG: hypothetical protein V1744_03620 [Candidatus Altiarchaeota archaeon]
MGDSTDCTRISPKYGRHIPGDQLPWGCYNTCFDEDDNMIPCVGFYTTTTAKKRTTTTTLRRIIIIQRVTTTTHRTTTTTRRTTTTTRRTTTTTASTSTTIRPTTTTRTTITTTTLRDIEQLDITPYPTYVNKSKYCGPENRPWVMAVIPRGPPGSGIDFNPACYGHDRCYSQCAMTLDAKESCDEEFSKELDQICVNKIHPSEKSCKNYGWYNPFRYTCLLGTALKGAYCYSSADIYWFAVSKFANCYNAYPCYVDKYPWIPCI